MSSFSIPQPVWTFAYKGYHFYEVMQSIITIETDLSGVFSLQMSVSMVTLTSEVDHRGWT